MKKKFVMFLLTICLIIPCAFIFVACDKGDNPPTPDFLGYEIYINGQKTRLFECTSGETAITPQNLTIGEHMIYVKINDIVLDDHINIFYIQKLLPCFVF